MDNIQKQLIAKLGEEFTNIFPLQYVSNILDKATGETLTILLTRCNHVFIPFTGDKNVTRAAVPAIMRRKGLYITYITPDSVIITEYFKGNKTEVNNEDWVKDENWGTNITSDNFVPITLPDGSVTAEKLSQEVLDLIGQGFKGNIENHPDGEDLTSTELATVGNTKYKVLRFADRNYTQDGMGYVILRKNKSFASQLTQQNTIYVIHYNFILTSDVTIPENCILEFDGGSIMGEHTITGTNTGINASLVKIFNTDVTLAGTWNITEAYPEWFGAKGDGIIDDALAIQKCYDYFFNIKLSGKSYFIKSFLTLNEVGSIRGIGNHSVLRIDKPVVIGISSISISDLQFLYADTNNRPDEAIIFESSDGADIYNVNIDRCLLNGIKQVITVKSYISDIHFNNCWFNRNDNIWKDEVPYTVGHKKGIIFNGCLLDWTSNTIMDATSSSILFIGCYFGIFSSYTINADSLSRIKYLDCVFEVMNELSSESKVPIINTKVSYFERCRFSSNKAVNYYWFQVSEGITSIKDTTFHDWATDKKIGGIFNSYLLQTTTYGSIILDNVLINNIKINSPIDIDGIWNSHYPLFDIKNGYGITFIEGSYDIEKLVAGNQYTLLDASKTKIFYVTKIGDSIKYLATSSNPVIDIYLSNVSTTGSTVEAASMPFGLYNIEESLVAGYSAIIYVSNTHSISVVADPNSIFSDNYLQVSTDADKNIVFKNTKSTGTNLTITKIDL